MDKIVVLDFGSQYSHLICRRIRDFSVYAELVPFNISLENLNKLNPKGIIFSGGPSSVYDSNAPLPDEKIFQLNVPILGICYGHQIIVNNFGGKIKRANTALLIHKAIGNRLACVFVDNGLLRLNEAEEVENMFRKNFEINFTKIDEQEQFLSRLNGVTDPEEKRKIVGEEFVNIFTKFSKENGPFTWLAQGTLYPDVIESGVSKGPASVIKTHHNVGGLPDWLDLKVLEPLRDLYKDEVRKVAKIIGVPENLLMRHPFPGPGLAVRIIGEVTKKKLEITRVASKIVEEELQNADLYDKVWQAYAAVGDDKAVGVVGDERKYGNIVVIRVVDSVDAMTADWTRLPNELLEKMSNRITNEIDDVTWVSYVVSSKPPATIEPQ